MTKEIKRTFFATIYIKQQNNTDQYDLFIIIIPSPLSNTKLTFNPQ